MEGSKREKDFESLWAERFANAEVEPAEHVWKNISGELANSQVGTYKKRLVYYKWAAAASLILAFTLGVLYYTQSTLSTSEQILAESNTNTTTESNLLNDSEPSQNNSERASKGNESLAQTREEEFSTLENRANQNLITEASDGLQYETQGLGNEGNSIMLADNNNEEDFENGDNENFSDNNSGVSNNQAIAIVDEDLEEELGYLIISLKSLEENSILMLTALPDKIYSVPVYANAFGEDDDSNTQRGLWAGINLGSGNFDPNYGAPTGNTDEALAVEEAFAPALDANTAGLPLQEESRPGPTIEVGIDVGKPVGDKWVLQSGLRYGRYTVNSETNLVFSSADGRTVPLSFQNRDGLFAAEELVVSSESVEVDNNFQLLSVPFKAGFLVLDKKFNILLNAGMSGDIYLGNQLNSNSSR
ncbi:MAG: hypothetical protein AAGC88_13755, partial [Bacteroidota bacterium]